MEKSCCLVAQDCRGLHTLKALRGSLLSMKDKILKKRRGFWDTCPVGQDFLVCMSSSGRL